jgi:hypothetical protein
MLAISKKMANAKVAAYLRQRVSAFGAVDANCMIAPLKRISLIVVSVAIFHVPSWWKPIKMKTLTEMAWKLKILNEKGCFL